ncbi:MAG: hypothetical protein LBT93_06505 [Treponema sp.]|jgi:hypothetical protein|nr:hypothetical protein [Treponema sp.]
MSILSYLETLPLSRIAKCTKGSPQNGIPFIGYPRQHPSEKHKLILIYDPLGQNPKVLEFKLEDVLLIEEVPSAITESGEGVPLVKLWIRKGAHGVILEPFEVEESIRFVKNAKDFGTSFPKQRTALGGQP